MPSTGAPTVVRVPAGAVTLSDRRLQRSWTVDVDAFELAACPVTQQEYAGVTGHWPSAARGPQLPVDSVSWWDAVRYCNARSQAEGRTPAYRLDGPQQVEQDRAADGYRLPTEAEWEHACRAGTTGPRYGELDDIARHRGRLGRAEPAGRQEAARRMRPARRARQRVEWCRDVYDADVYGEYRVLRGGGWSDEHWSCRASVRRRSHPTLRIEDVGFRVARSC